MEYVGNILYDEELLRKNKKIIIFGAGMYGRRILHYLERNNAKGNVSGFCDSDENKQGKCIEAIPVYNVDEAWKKYPEAVFLVSGRYMDEMYKELRDKGISKVHMLFF